MKIRSNSELEPTKDAAKQFRELGALNGGAPFPGIVDMGSFFSVVNWIAANSGACSSHRSPYDPVRVVNADP